MLMTLMINDTHHVLNEVKMDETLYVENDGGPTHQIRTATACNVLNVDRIDHLNYPPERLCNN